jgi:uncharacterized protein (UPF0335 family)
MTHSENLRMTISIPGSDLPPIETDTDTINRAAARLGHNSGAPRWATDDLAPPPPPTGGDTGGIAAQKLRSFVERIERLESEKADLASDIKEVFAEAKGNGFDTKIMRKVIQLRKLPDEDRKEQDELLDLYRRALEV